MSNSNRNGSGKNGNGNSKNGNNKKGNNKLTAQQIAVIAGLLTNALEVESVLVDRSQQVQIVLTGSLKRKTKADELVEQMSGMSVGDLLNAFLRR